jgi:hypothetical protein
LAHGDLMGAVVPVPESTMKDTGGAPCWDDDRLAERDVSIALDELAASIRSASLPSWEARRRAPDTQYGWALDYVSEATPE